MFVKAGIFGGNKGIDQRRRHFSEGLDNPPFFKKLGDFTAVIRVYIGDDGRMIFGQ